MKNEAGMVARLQVMRKTIEDAEWIENLEYWRSQRHVKPLTLRVGDLSPDRECLKVDDADGRQGKQVRVLASLVRAGGA